MIAPPPPAVLDLPDPSLVVLIGAAGAGKSTFAARQFPSAAIHSSDACRQEVSGDAGDQNATTAAFALVHERVGRALQELRLAVVDATSIHGADRAPLLALARRHHLPRVAIVLHPTLEQCLERNAARERVVPPAAVRRQWMALQASIDRLQPEGYHAIWRLDSAEAIDAARIRLQPLPCDRRRERGPFDVIGDVHGCDDELARLLRSLGYLSGLPHPRGRRAVFVGDLVDRGPQVPAVLRRVMAMCAAGQALCVLGNHERKLLRKLDGGDPLITHGLAESLAQLSSEPADFLERVRAFLRGLPDHLLLDGGDLVVAHAGMREDLQGRQSRRVNAFALYGDPSGEVDAAGLPVRRDWAARYGGPAAVVYGHTPTRRAAWRNNTICVDTGCVFGGALSAVRWPERDVVSVPALRVHYGDGSTVDVDGGG